MKKKYFISIILAVALCLAGCQSKNVDMGQAEQANETSKQIAAAETTEAPEESINVYETLAEGQERDWKIEDVLKNDLEIDGIPVSLPCTVGELLDTLGKNYSIDEAGNLCYKDKQTVLAISKSEGNNVKECVVRGFYSKYSLLYAEKLYNTEKGIIKLDDVSNTSTCLEFLGKYNLPNEIKIDNSESKKNIKYYDENCYIYCVFNDNIITTLFIGYNSGENE